MAVAPRYRRSGLAADALRRALRQRVIHNQGYQPGQLNERQQQDVRQRTQNRLGNMREKQPGLDTLNPALRKQFLETRNRLQAQQQQKQQPGGGGGGGNAGGGQNKGQPSGVIQIPHVKINPNGQLDLPYDPNMADSILDAKDQMNQRLLELQQQDQAQQLEFTQLQRDAGIDYNNLARQTLNQYSGKGMAFSSGYGNAVAENSTDYSNYMNDLTQSDALFDQGIASERGQIETRFNEMLRRWALNQGRKLSENAGDLGYGKGTARPVGTGGGGKPGGGGGNNNRPGGGGNKGKGFKPGNSSTKALANGFFGTQNMGTKKDRADLLKLIQANPEVLTLAELGGKKGMRRTKRVLNKHGYGFRGKGGVGIAWDKDEQKLLNFNTKRLSNRTFVGKKGAGPSTLRAKDANWARFKDRDTKKRNVYTTAHLAPSIRIPVRGKLHKQQVQGLAELQRELHKMFPKASRTVLGDMNTSKAKRLRPLMKKAGLTAYKAPGKTHRVGSIDWILSDAKLRKRLLRDYGSDHRAYFGRMR